MASLANLPTEKVKSLPSVQTEFGNTYVKYMGSLFISFSFVEFSTISVWINLLTIVECRVKIATDCCEVLMLISIFNGIKASLLSYDINHSQNQS